MGNNCSCISKEEPSEVTVDKKPGTRKEATPLIEAQVTSEPQQKEEQKWTADGVQMLQSAVRAYVQRKQQREPIRKLVVLEWLDEPEVLTVKNPKVSELPPLSAEAAVKRDSIPAFAYSIKIVPGDVMPPALMSDDSVYVGQWKDGKRYGRGVSYQSNGGFMEGYWSNGLHLLGRVIYTNGDIYEGEFVHMKKEGRGRFEDASGKVSYEGGWIADLKHGTGTEKMADGSTYEGLFQDDKKEGIGRFVWPTGEVYVGEFHENKIHGRGKYVWNENKWYEGDWFEGSMHGKGHLMQEGKDYDGDFVKDKKHGTGVLKWENNLYEGGFDNNKMHGQGWLSTKGKPKKLYAFENNKRGLAIEEPAAN